MPEILRAVLEIFPLDGKAEKPVAIIVDWDGPKQAIWEECSNIIQSSGEADKFQHGFDMVPPDDFMERSRRCYALVATTERPLAGNILLRKGLMQQEACGEKGQGMSGGMG